MAVKREKKAPGVMVYYDLIPALELMSREERGDLFLSLLKYARDLEEPENMGQATRFLWEIVRQRVDADHLRYEQTCLNKRYAAYVKARKEKGLDYLDYDEWVVQVSDT